MVVSVWVDFWQMQCCGDPFAVGDEVSWTLRDPDTAWLERALGSAGDVDKAEEHHGNVSDDVTPTVGVVASIRTVHCRCVPVPDGTETRFLPVPGTGVLSAVESADGWVPDQGDLQFLGYVVHVRT